MNLQKREGREPVITLGKVSPEDQEGKTTLCMDQLLDKKHLGHREKNPLGSGKQHKGTFCGKSPLPLPRGGAGVKRQKVMTPDRAHYPLIEKEIGGHLDLRRTSMERKDTSEGGEGIWGKRLSKLDVKKLIPDSRGKTIKRWVVDQWG